MADAYQWAKADGHVDWTQGATNFHEMWTNVFDVLRFHRGAGFTIANPPKGPGPTRKLDQIADVLGPQVEHSNYDDVYVVTSAKDKYQVKVRKHAVVTAGDLVVRHARDQIGTPYVLGGTDCSWLSMHCYGMAGVTLPHNAYLQHQLFKSGKAGLTVIQKAQIKPGDLLFHHNDDHVSVFMDWLDNGRVVDEEPHGVQGPWGAYINPGCQVRPMRSGYYCDWENVCGIGRATSINGKP